MYIMLFCLIHTENLTSKFKFSLQMNVPCSRKWKFCTTVNGHVTGLWLSLMDAVTYNTCHQWAHKITKRLCTSIKMLWVNNITCEWWHSCEYHDDYYLHDKNKMQFKRICIFKSKFNLSVSNLQHQIKWTFKEQLNISCLTNYEWSCYFLKLKEQWLPLNIF